MADTERTRSDSDLVSAVERYLHDIGWGRPDLALTDVLVLTVRRGFDESGSKSLTSMLTPTEDSAVATLIGMCRFGSIQFEGMAARSMQEGE